MSCEIIKVCVLMSTYNGEKYLSEQLDSILAQRNVKTIIKIRDDGSTDNTIEILKHYKNKYSNINIDLCNNVGYARSFFSLLKNAGDFDYYAFSDQDDVWDLDKLTIAITNLKNNDLSRPLLYSCNLRLVDESLNYICDMRPPQESDFQKGRYLLDKYSYGCTMVFNRKMRDLALIYDPNQSISHDNWMGLLAVFLGNFIFDSNCHINYRQHGNNVVGGNNTLYGTWKRRIKNIGNLSKHSRALIAEELLNGYRNILDETSIRILELMANYKKSIRNKIILMVNPNLQRASKEKNFVFKILIILSKA